MVETEDKLTCDICGKEVEEVYMFGAYGDNSYKIKDGKEYCEVHFVEADHRYDSIVEGIF